MKRFCSALRLLAFGALTAIAVAGPKPAVWIYTDMSDKAIPGKNHMGTVNDPDDISAMAGYLLLANEFDTRGIVVASTHRPEHATTPDQAVWADRVFGEAYRAEVANLNRHLGGGFPANVSFVQSSIKQTAERFDPVKTYASLDAYPTVRALFDETVREPAGGLINVLCWGSLTEPAILVNHCLATGQSGLLKKLRFIGHWTDSPLHQGTPQNPEHVANCREDAAACAYLKARASEGKVAYHECGAIGQHGIVSGAPRGADHYEAFKVSRLGRLFAEGKFVQGNVDHSDSATYWVLLGTQGVTLADIPGDGSNTAVREKANEDTFRASSPALHAELLRRARAAAAPAWQPVADLMLTPWGEKVTPDNAWREYPRPTLKRFDPSGQLAWQNLNGLWSLAITADDAPEPKEFTRQILVPFAVESPLSGVGRPLDPFEALWYRRTFAAPTTPANGRVLLNFEAVDYQTTAWLNGHKLGEHTGGNLPFSFDLTPHLKTGENTLVVRVLDATDTKDRYQLTGKQRLKNGGIFYTRSSGIHQTVWLESAPALHVADVTINTDISDRTGVIRLSLTTNTPSRGISARVTVRDGDKTIATSLAALDPARADRLSATLSSSAFTFWTPDHPKLYALDIELLDANGKTIDRTESYTGIRTVGRIRDASGHWRFSLNGKPIFHYGPLDQGWWPDGLLTPPSVDAMKWEITWLKSAGFNLIRKHIKVEPRAYYTLCDQIGMLVWQDQVSGGTNPKWQQLHGRAPDPTKKANPNHHQAGDPLDATWPDAAHAQWMAELKGMVDHLRIHPSIVVWTPFNERWGQHRTVDVGRWITAYDPTRLINIASGGNFFPVGHIFDAHAYPAPDLDFNYPGANDFIKVVGEFGGHGWPVEGHLWKSDNKKFVYGAMPKDLAEYTGRYEKTTADLLALKARGIAAGVYTQTTDVEVEINGLMTYDRKVIKIPAAQLRAWHAPLYRE